MFNFIFFEIFSKVIKYFFFKNSKFLEDLPHEQELHSSSKSWPITICGTQSKNAGNLMRLQQKESRKFWCQSSSIRSYNITITFNDLIKVASDAESKTPKHKLSPIYIQGGKLEQNTHLISKLCNIKNILFISMIWIIKIKLVKTQMSWIQLSATIGFYRFINIYARLHILIM